MWYTTENQLRECPFGDYVLSFAEMYSPPYAKWEFRSVHQDANDNHLYYATFDIPSRPGTTLSFKFRVDDSKPGPPDVSVISGDFKVGIAL